MIGISLYVLVHIFIKPKFMNPFKSYVPYNEYRDIRLLLTLKQVIYLNNRDWKKNNTEENSNKLSNKNVDN